MRGEPRVEEAAWLATGALRSAGENATVISAAITVAPCMCANDSAHFVLEASLKQFRDVAAVMRLFAHAVHMHACGIKGTDDFHGERDISRESDR